MGRLFEILLELVVNGILELVMFVYLKLTSLFVPNKVVSPKEKNKIQNIVTIISVLLTLTLFIGLLFLLPDNPLFHTIGQYMTFIPLSILGIQVVLGIAIIIAKVIKKNSDSKSV